VKRERMSWEPVPQTRAEILSGCTEAQAFARLERAAWDIVNRARWYSLSSRGKVNEIRRPLLALKLARRKARLAVSPINEDR
jgi:hypothetical protein